MKRRGKLWLIAFATGALISPVFSPPGSAQELSRRLILKDGSYQLVTKYEVKGNRVHYFSAEREEWEDLPSSLVDWTATDKYEKERAAGAAAPEAVQLDKEAADEQETSESAQPQVAPGLRLPEDSGVFLLDSFQGQAQLDELQQTSGDVNQDKKGNILRSVINPVAGAKAMIELDGAHAKIQAHVDVPSLYINVEDDPNQLDQQRIRLDSARDNQSTSQHPQQPEQPQQPVQPVVPFDRFRIVQTEVKGGKRIVGDVKRAVTGKVSQEQHFVKTTITKVNGGWLKLTPAEPLAPGEYAVVEMMGKEGMNLYVWDFGVNPKAAPNANPWKPEAKAAAAPTPATPPAPKDK